MSNYHINFVIGRRLFDEDRPLQEVLESSVVGRSSKLALRDNLCSTIQWDAFSLPELQNFITILGREENLYADKVSVYSAFLLSSKAEGMLSKLEKAPTR